MLNGNHKQKSGKVFLVGAGPGDPGLITVKGLDCIRRADVLVYDRLVGSRLLDSAGPEAERIYVGKLPDSHTLRQEEINEVLLNKAREGLTVVRLKGGDPFVFGRGGEEAEYLTDNGIPFEVVPGITSAIAVPAYAGIPVTHRHITSSFAVITGHEEPGKENSHINWEKISTGAGTLVFLMGVANLPLIVEKLLENGLTPETPVALVRWGTLPEQRTLEGSLADIVEKVQATPFQSAAVIVVGRVVELRKKLQWFEKKPLFGKQVVVTRATEQAGLLARRIEALGGEPAEFPVISIAPPLDYTLLDRAIAAIESYHWLIFTSVNGVDYFFRRWRQHNRDIRDLKGIRFCAIGPRTREALEERGLLVEFVPSEYRAEGIAEQLQGVLKPGERVLLPRAELARPVLPDTLIRMGAQVDSVVAYRTLQGAGDGDRLRQMLETREVDAVTFTSSSTVHNFINLLGEEGRALLNGVALASIGPITSATARDLGLVIDLEAEEYTIDGLIKALEAYFAHQERE